jgi:hypothetical protein
VIRIEKPATPPEILTTKGKQKRKNHVTTYSRNPTAYQSGDQTFTFDRTIYAHTTVKNALVKAQRCQKQLAQSIQADAKFSAAARSAIKTNFQYVLA